MTVHLLLLSLMLTHATADDALRAALAQPLDRSAPLVSFSTLWEHPDLHAGTAVVVQGRATRRFCQPDIRNDAGDSTWPALTELWLITPGGNPITLIYPTPDDADPVSLGATVEFSGIFLRLVDYAAADATRRSPLIAGPLPPRPVPDQADTTASSRAEPNTQGWLIPAIGAALTGLAVAYLQLRRATPADDLLGIETEARS